MAATYTGRFAPSPTGPLHFGSLVAALASYLDARAQGGRWLVRMEDIDPPREVPGAAALILRQLERHGLAWDGEVLYQSSRFGAYQAVVTDLLARGEAYPCSCSRQRLQRLDGVYDGHCRGRTDLDPARCAVRLRVPPGTVVHFDDLFQGDQGQDLNREQGDFIIRRRDGLPAYQLAVTVDDAFQGVSHVIRGGDLLHSTGRQIFLFGRLGRPAPAYGHIPVAVNRGGQKLSKQNLAPSLDGHRPADNLRRALVWLGIDTPPSDTDPTALLAWAAGQWRRERIPAGLTRGAPAGDDQAVAAGGTGT